MTSELINHLDTATTGTLLPMLGLERQQRAAGDNPAVVYVSGLAENSQRTMTMALNTIANILGFSNLLECPWWQLESKHTSFVRAELRKTQYNYKPATINVMLAALRGTLRTAWEMRQIDTETYQRAISFKAIKHRSDAPAVGQHLSDEHLRALLEQCIHDPRAAGRRDIALLLLLIACGLRRSEPTRLDLANYDQSNSTITVVSKGQVTRTMPLHIHARAALDAWIRVRGTHSGPLFVRIRKGDDITRERLTPQAVYYIVQQRAKHAGIELTPHDFRRTFAGNLLTGGVDLVTVQKLMGHSSPVTTAMYDRRDDKAKADAVATLNIPLPALSDAESKQ